MRGFLLGSAYLAVAVLLGSLLAWAIDGILDAEYAKVLSRSVLVFAALGLIPLWRLLGLTRVSIGLTDFSYRVLTRAFAVGAAAIAPIILFYFVVGFRFPVPDAQLAEINLLTKVPWLVVAAFLVSLFEEVLFRGVLLTALVARWGVGVGVVVSSLVYAAVHFLAAGSEGVARTWYAGFVYLGKSLQGLASPADYWDSFVSLFLLGVLFCVVRRRFGLWWCIGLHAAWVFAIRMQSAFTDRDIVNPFVFAVGDYDNFVGHLVSVWLLFLFLLLHLNELRKSAY